MKLILKENHFVDDEQFLDTSEVDFNFSSIRDDTAKKMLRAFENNKMASSGVWNWILDNQKSTLKMFDEGDIERIKIKYFNFFRDPQLSRGLVSSSLLADIGSNWRDGTCVIQKSEGNFVSNENIRKRFINLVLQDIETSKDLTEFDKIPGVIENLAGNPYGVRLNKNLYTADQPRHFYLANKIYNILEDVHNPIIFEIGGGYGGLYLNLVNIFGNKKFTYINFDILTTSLSFIHVVENTLPSKNVFINDGSIVTGERMLSESPILNIYNSKEDLKNNLFEISPDLCVNSHSLSEMSKEDVTAYIEFIENNKIKYFLHVNSSYFPWEYSNKGHIDISAKNFPITKYKKLSQSLSPWLAGGHTRYREYLYEFCKEL